MKLTLGLDFHNKLVACNIDEVAIETQKQKSDTDSEEFLMKRF